MTHGGTQQLRALVGARVSVWRKGKRSPKVSHIAQHETGLRKAQEMGAEVVDTFEDLDVSAQLSPFDRPDLGPWLDDGQRAHMWDVIIWSKLDRGFRDPKDAIDLAAWCEARGKVMILVDDGITLDFRPAAHQMTRMMSEMFLLIGSMFAKWELKRFQSRALDAHSVLRELDRWAGGIAPEGFDIVPHASGRGKTLDTNGNRKKLLHEMAGEVLGGDSFNGIAIKLTERNIRTNSDRQREPDERRGVQWSATEIIDALTSPATQGIKLHKGQPVLNGAGMPVQISPPTFDDHTWRRLQLAIAERRHKGKSRRVNGASPLLGVGYCGTCQHGASQKVNTQDNGKVYRYYRCGRTPKSCVGVAMRADQVDALIEQSFLEECGHLPVLERVFVPGEDHTEELNKVKASIARLERESDMGLIRTPSDESRYFERMQSLVDRRSELESLPQRAAGWDYRSIGTTYSHEWNNGDQQRRRKLLVDAGVRFLLHGRDRWEVQIPKDIRERLQKAT